MGFNFIDCDRDQQFKLPQDVRDWMPPDHLCWKVLEVVGRIDLSGFMSGYRSDGQGRAAYHPATMLSLVLYCYAKGIRSSRCIEEACIDDVGCRIITANHKVDHSTISRFIRRHQIPLKDILIQSLSLCAQQGLIDLTAVAIDGSPVEANSSRASNRTLQRLESIIAECEAGIENLLQQFPEPEEDHGAEMGDSSFAQLSRLSGRLIRANSARSKLHERAMPSAGEIKIKVDAAVRMVDRAQQRLSAETSKHRARLDGHARRTAEDQAAGLRGTNGRPPVPLDEKTVIVRQRARLARAIAWLERARAPRPVPSPEARASLTDPDSRLMLGKQGGYLQGYNVQIACSLNQLILAVEVQDNPSDMTALVPMVRKVQQNCVKARIRARIEAWLADSGYASAANFDALSGIPLFVAVSKGGNQNVSADEVPESVPLGQRAMAMRLSTPIGKSIYKRRGALVEPGFAQLFQRFGRHLRYRGFEATDTELKILAAVHNLAKLFRHEARYAYLTH